MGTLLVVVVMPRIGNWPRVVNGLMDKESKQFRRLDIIKILLIVALEPLRPHCASHAKRRVSAMIDLKKELRQL